MGERNHGYGEFGLPLPEDDSAIQAALGGLRGRLQGKDVPKDPEELSKAADQQNPN